MLELLTDPEAWLGLLSLTLLELVLGIDNLVFIAILTDRLPKENQAIAYRLGLLGALGTRIALLLCISWLTHLVDPLVEVLGHALSGKDLVLLAGGLFLIGKASQEIYEKVELADEEEGDGLGARSSSLLVTVVQISLLDIVFSLDSVITAVGMVEDVTIMITAIVVAVCLMLIFAQAIGDFVNRHPSMKILALSFLILIGVLLTAEALGQEVSKGYVYAAMSFALFVELINMRFRKKTQRKSPPAGAPSGSE